MPIGFQTPFNEYVGDDVTDEFTRTFRVDTLDDFSVLVDDVVQTYEVDYVVDLNELGEDTGTITFLVPPALNAVVHLQRAIVFERTTDFVQGAAIPADTVDSDFDRIWMALQDLAYGGFVNDTLYDLANWNTNGVLTFVGGAATFAARTFTSSDAGLVITNGSGVAGNPTFALDSAIQGWDNFNTNGILVQTAANTYNARTLTGTANQIDISNGTGGAGNPTFSLPSTNLTLPGTEGFYPPTGTTAQRPVAPTQGLIRYNSQTGFMEFYENSGWVTPGSSSGTVTSVAATAPAAGFTVAGSPITISGTLTFALADDLAALEAMAGTGVVTRTASDTYAQRSIAAGSAKLTVSNGDGVAGNPTIDFGSVAIDDLSDVTITAPATGAVLVYNGAAWVDGQVDLADADAVTGVLPYANGGRGGVSFIPLVTDNSPVDVDPAITISGGSVGTTLLAIGDGTIINADGGGDLSNVIAIGDVNVDNSSAATNADGIVVIGSDNDVFIDTGAGGNSVVIGSGIDFYGSQNVAIGYGVDMGSVGNQNIQNSVLLGTAAQSNASNQFMVGTAPSMAQRYESNLMGVAFKRITGQTTNATPTTLGTFAAGTALIPSNPQVVYYRGSVVAREDVTPAPKTQVWLVEFACLAQNSAAANFVLVGTPTVTSIGTANTPVGWAVTVTANTTNGNADINITGQAATTINWSGSFMFNYA